MKAGVVGIPEDSFGSIESFEIEEPAGEHELKRCIEVRQTINRTGKTIQLGRAAVQELSNEQQVSIEDGQVLVSERSQPISKYTEFLLVPGEFIVVDSGTGTFAFDLIGSHTGTKITRAHIDLQQFWETEVDGTPWKAGFYAHQGNAETGVVYGEDVLKDEDFGGGIDKSQINQIGLDYPPEENAIKMSATESGYVEIYQPENYDEKDYAKYLQNRVVPHLTTRE